MSVDVEWDAPAVNSHPFVTCPACEGRVELERYEPLMKVCVGCHVAYYVREPMRFRAQAHNTADAVAFALHACKLSWNAVSVVMRIYHNVELGGDGWRHRINSSYLFRKGQDPYQPPAA